MQALCGERQRVPWGVQAPARRTWPATAMFSSPSSLGARSSNEMRNAPLSSRSSKPLATCTKPVLRGTLGTVSRTSKMRHVSGTLSLYASANTRLHMRGLPNV
jgi:hypothetical protein